jgi:hypothetical protein
MDEKCSLVAHDALKIPLPDKLYQDFIMVDKCIQHKPKHSINEAPK